jgi:hypothetical protein
MIASFFCSLRRRAAGIFLAGLVAVMAPAPLRAAIPPAQNLLPKDTLLVLSVPDFATLRASARQSPQWLFWNDPAMKPFRDSFMAKWNENFIAPLERDLGVKLGDFADLPQGQLTFAVTQNGWNGSDDSPSPGILLLLDARGKSNLLTTNLANLRQKWREAGKPIHKETVRGISFSVVPLSSNSIPPTLAAMFPHSEPIQELGKKTTAPKPGELVVGQFESLLIVGNSLKAVEPVAARLTGGAWPPLSENQVFAADSPAQSHGAPLYYGWFNAKTVFDVLAHVSPAPPNPDAPSPFPQIPWDRVLDASGLTGLRSISFSYSESRAGAQFNLFLSVPAADRQGIFQMMAATAKDANPPGFVPADALKFFRWRIDGRRDWDTLEKMLGNISPAALTSLNSVLDIANAAAQQKDPNFDVRQDLIANLGNDFISYEMAPKGNTAADLKNAPSLLLFAASNPDQAALAINSIASMLPASQRPPDPRIFLGRKIYTIPLSRSPSSDNAPSASRSLYFAASGGYVALTTDVSLLEKYLRSDEGHGKPLSEKAGLNEAAQHVGGAGNGLFGYENQRELMRMLFDSLEKNPTGGLSGSPLLPLLSSGFNPSQWMDFSLLPDFDKVSKYFYFSVYGGNTTVNGLSFKFFTPRPPQLQE